MSVVRWRFNNNSDTDFTLDINPASDTGWLDEVVYALKHPIGRKVDVLQINGLRSRTRVAEGVTKTRQMYLDIRALVRKLGVFELTDHHNVTNDAFIVEFTPQEIHDASNLNETYKYKLKILKR